MAIIDSEQATGEVYLGTHLLQEIHPIFKGQTTNAHMNIIT
jgi:hypothetical protein